MDTPRFDAIVHILEELTISDEICPASGSQMNWVNGIKFPISETDATLDELREVGQAYGLYLHHCSHCDSWYFHWEKN